MMNQRMPSAATMAWRDQPECEELMRLIVKLRWIGLEDEADRLQHVVRGLPPEARATTLAELTGTD